MPVALKDNDDSDELRSATSKVDEWAEEGEVTVGGGAVEDDEHSG